MDLYALSPHGQPADLPGEDTERFARRCQRRRIYKAHPTCGWRTSRSSRVAGLVPGVPHLISGSCSSPRAFGLGFLQTPASRRRPCPSPSLRPRLHLARGLAPRSLCAMPDTLDRAKARGLPRPLQLFSNQVLSALAHKFGDVFIAAISCSWSLVETLANTPLE
jgi:hypothetical protein